MDLSTRNNNWISIFTCFGLVVFLYGHVGVVKGQAYYPPARITCTSMFPVPDPLNCTNYYQCFLVPPAEWIQMHFSCPSGGIFEKKYLSCVEGTCDKTGAWVPPGGGPTPTPKPKPGRPAAAKPPPRPTKRPPPPASSVSKVTTRRPSVASPTPKPGLYRCPGVGQFPHPVDPSKYNICVVHKGRFYYYVHKCPPGACYSQTRRLCAFGTCPKELS